MKRSALRLSLAALFLILLSACDSLGYYHQAISGQLAILSRRQAIPELLDADDTPATLKVQLQQVSDILAFAEQQLGLPVGKQFSSYVDLQRPYVVWNVFAAPADSLQLQRWCYPVAGCVTYRGFFKEASARQYASRLEKDGKDVYVGGVTAYSTLGWFADPLLNTVINRRPDQLASLIFHELAHQQLYIKDDTVFNESFATAVQQIGSERWIARHMDESSGAQLLGQIRLEERYRQQFVALIQGAVDALQEVYEGAGNRSVSLQENKRVVISQLRRDYQQLKQQWQGYSAYDGWFAGELNNAKLATVSAYNDLVPAFLQLYRQCEQQLPCLYVGAGELASLPTPERSVRLQQLTGLASR